MVFRVDRQGFLVAVAAIAAACGASTPPQTLVVAIPAEPSASPPPAPTEPPQRPIAPSNEGVSRPIASAAPAPTDEGQVPPATEGYTAPTREGYSAPTDPKSDDGAMCRAKKVAARPTTCADDRGAPGDCKKGNCDLGFVCEQCEAYKRFFKPKIAERAVACVVGQTRVQARDGCRTYQCGDEALKSACIDPTVDADCKAIAKSCNATLDTCRGMLSGMNAAGRVQIAKCAAKGCPYGLWSCVEGI